MYNKKHGTHFRIKLISYKVPKSFLSSVRQMDDFSCAISGISITEERKQKYDFSVPYMPAKEVIISLKKYNHHKNDWKKKNAVIAYRKNTIHANHIKVFKNNYSKSLIGLDTRYIFNHLEKSDNHFIIGDISDVWEHKNLMFVSNFKEANLSYYGILLPKRFTIKRHA